MFLISGGVKTQEFEQVLDSSKHPMSWVTPRVSGSDVEIEFGFLEQDGNSERLGTFAHVTFDSPHLVGSNTRHSSLRVENNQKVLFYYWVKREEGVSFSVAEELSDSVRLKTSEEKPVDFLVVTIANQ